MAGVTQPKVSRVDALELVEWARAGRIRIPQFQRSYAWDASDAERLFDSILRGYPIGNLLMWRKPAPAGRVTLGEWSVDADERSDALWVVDGQQRLTTLIGALTASEDTVDRRFRIFYDLQEEKFVSASHAQRLRDSWLPMWIAKDNRILIAWQRERPWLTVEQYDLCDAVSTALRTYEIPMYEIEGDDEKALTEIFDRMNTFGKALKRAEIFRALHSAPLDVQPSGLDALGERVNALEFGTFPPQLLMQSVMAVRGGKVDRDFRQEFKDDEDLHSAFAQTEKALRLVVDFLRTDAGIPHRRLLPYALFIPVLARYAALFGRPRGRGAELLRRWIWRGSVVGVAPQGNTVGLRRNAGAVDEDPVDSANRLLEMLPPGGERWKPDLSQTALNRAQAKLNVLGMLSTKPVLLVDVDRAEGHHYAAGTRIERTGLLTDLLNQGGSPLVPVLPGAETIAGRLLHPAVPEDYGALLCDVTDETVLRSHCLDPAAVEALRSGAPAGFLQRRSELVAEAIARHVQSMALWGFTDGPEPEDWFADVPGDANAE
ncbi:DUF262 domain-containing protein [Streptomyces sp. NA04227]|uniref:DUF262 domain-containing protein n=1 Tax=Streptomyces sp. NA04227 TaxID=2742136 RepID=UPI0015902031|nr:DUF262 domain-containing protein [Streptomyces sp. NA04227]QKW08840.1 DUF262 domain-containing protein [Streptomyces sp. NA04227]